MSKFRQSDSAESSSSSSSDEQTTGANLDEPTSSVEPGTLNSYVAPEIGEDDIAVSHLALKDESSPEAWLGQFLLELDMPGASTRATIAGARSDPALIAKLTEVRDASTGDAPLRLFDAEYGANLRSSDWAAWWRTQETLSRFCYSTLALALLGNTQYAPDLAQMYRQNANSRIHKDAHYVLCYLLGKPWPAYQVTDKDLERLNA
jgi:hypothetical protein